MKPDHQTIDLCSTVADCSTSEKGFLADENLIPSNVFADGSAVADKNPILTVITPLSSLEGILRHLRQLGVSLELVEGKIKYRGPTGIVTPEIVEALQSRRKELLAFLEKESAGPSAGKRLIRETLDQIAAAWEKIERCEGDLVWEWILRGSHHGELIHQAENRVDAIGSRGDKVALKAACDAWLLAWRDGIEDWKRHRSVITTKAMLVNRHAVAHSEESILSPLKVAQLSHEDENDIKSASYEFDLWAMDRPIAPKDKSTVIPFPEVILPRIDSASDAAMKPETTSDSKSPTDSKIQWRDDASPCRMCRGTHFGAARTGKRGYASPVIRAQND